MNNRKPILNCEIAEQLRNSYFKETNSKNKAIKFPSAFSVSDIGSGFLEIFAKRASINANMQTNDNAIEAWALILNRWLGKKILISWETPSELEKFEDLLNYRRFLYRLENLPITEEIVISDKMEPEIQKNSIYQIEEFLFVNSGNLNLRNTPYDQRKLSTENDFELFFFNHQECLSKIFSYEYVFRQFPVGLFRKSVKRGNELFPARKSAIDIVLADKENIIVIELKKPGNKSVGVISELLFYCYFIRDIVKGNFHFLNEKPFPENANHVFGCLLLSEGDRHPLIDRIVLEYAGLRILKSGLPIKSHFYRLSKGGDSCEIM